jgi:hypothetical protein
MTRRPGLRLLALLAPVVLLVPTSAHAEKVVTEDAAGDVMSLAGEFQEPDQAQPAPDHTGVDVVRTAVAHGAHRLRVSVRFRDLAQDSAQIAVARVRTARGDFEITLERLRGKPTTSLVRGRKSLECRGLKARVDRDADTLVTSLPTSCLDDPRWVQVGVGAVAVDAGQTSPQEATIYADDAHRTGEIRDRIALGPRVRRG